MDYYAQLLWVPQSNLPLEQAVDEMFARVDFMNSWLKNDIDTAQFLDALDECRIDVFDLADQWDNNNFVV